MTSFATLGKPTQAQSADIPKEQWACIIEQTGGPVEYKKIPVQTPGPDEVLINVKYSGVCHTVCCIILVVNQVFGPVVLMLSMSRISTLSRVTGLFPQSCPWSVATRVLVLLLQRES